MEQAWAIGGINPNIVSPTAYIWSGTSGTSAWAATLLAAVLYSGSHTTNLVGNGNAGGIVSYGVDINEVPGALTREPLAPLRYGLTPALGKSRIRKMTAMPTMRPCRLTSKQERSAGSLSVLHTVFFQGRRQQVSDAGSCSIQWTLALGCS